ncbi:mitochondrial ribosomal protein S34 isoform X2 [Oratosquilla oratoria]
MVVRTKFERYPEPSFYRIIRAEPEMDPENRKGRVWVERFFRGENKGIVEISQAAYKTDYRLVPKHEESKYLETVPDQPKAEKVMPYSIEMPPLLKLYAEQNQLSTTVKFVGKPGRNYRVANEGEESNCNITPGLGEPASPQLYEGVL